MSEAIIADTCRTTTRTLGEVTVRGANGLGDHVTGSVRLLLPAGGAR